MFWSAETLQSHSRPKGLTWYSSLQIKFYFLHISNILIICSMIIDNQWRAKAPMFFPSKKNYWTFIQWGQLNKAIPKGLMAIYFPCLVTCGKIMQSLYLWYGARYISHRPCMPCIGSGSSCEGRHWLEEPNQEWPDPGVHVFCGWYKPQRWQTK